MAIYGGQVKTIPYQAPDYGPSVAAARDLAMTQAQGVAGMIGQVGDYFKQQGEKKKLIKKSDVQIDAALKLFPDLAPALQGYRDQLKDENLPLDDRMAIADSISNVIDMGIGEMRNASNLLMQQQRLGMDRAYKEAQLGLKERQVAATEFGAQQSARPKLEGKKRVVNIDGQEVEVDIDEDQYGNKYVPGTGEKIINLEKYITGEEGALGGLPTPTSQVMPYDGPFKFSYDTRDQLPASSPTNRQISLDFNAAANKNAKGIEIIIPNNATKEERQIAQEYVAKTQQYFADRGVNVPVRGVKTAKQNGRGTPNRFHTEPFFVGDAASRAVMEKDPDGYAQVLASTLGRIPGAMFIPPHKSNDPGASDGKFNERDFAKGSIIPALERLSQQRSAQASSTEIDNALAMGGDMTQQAMGTPEQQAIMARMIEEGQGMAMAQNMPQGATPTEPSIATQQPQLPQPQRRIVRGVLVGGGKAAPTRMTAEQVNNLTARGFKVDALPTVDGGFMVSGVTAGGQTPRYTKTPEEELQSQRLTTLDKEQADLRSAGLSESQNIAQLKGIKDLLDSNVKTGFGRETIMKAKRVLGKDVANEEQFGSLVGNEAMKNIALTKGAISDREMEYFKTVLSPNMGKTTEGNKKIIDFKIRYAERASKIAKTITKMQSQKADPYQIQEQIDNIIASEPLFSPSDSNVTPQTQAESDANFLEGFRSGE